jgi:hypothetical protein
MKNVTLSAEEQLIEQAREKAQSRHASLNDEFRAWLGSYVAEASQAGTYEAIMTRLSRIESGGPFSRDEANER